VPAAKAAWSRTTPRNPAPASFATVSPRSPRRRMPRPRPGVGGTGAWARRDRMWGRLLERSRSLRPFGEGVGVAPPPVPRKAGAPVLLMYALAPSKRRHTPPRTPRHPRAVRPRSADRSRSSTHAFRRDACSSRRPSRPRRVQRVHQKDLASAAAGATHRVARNAARLGRQSHGCPRSCWPPANTAEHHDHGSGLGVDQASVLANHRRAVRSCRIGERRVGPGAAIRVQRAAEHHR
jgi:hypothetical protein